MTFTAPVRWFGTRTAKLLSSSGTGYADDSVNVVMTDRSERLAFAGPGGECIFTALYVTTRHFATDVSFTVAVVVDNVTVQTFTLALTGGSAAGVRQTHELILWIAYTRSAVERFRTAPRGTWFEVVITSVAPGAKQIIEDVEVEYEVVRESMQGEAR